MPSHTRRWRITDVHDAVELAEEITKNNWCLCVGFRLNGILWLNDSAGPDGAQEWAMVRERDGRQYESITVGWQEKAEDAKSVAEYQMKYQFGTSKPMFGEGQNLEPDALEHQDDCRLCA